MSTKQKKNGSNRIVELARNNSVPLMFILICAVCIPVSGFSPGYLLNEIMTRLGRNAFLILSLLIPIMAGMGLNFGMTLGAMAGQIGLIFAADWQIWGIPGIILAMIISIPISILVGIFCGKMLNRAKGREMIDVYKRQLKTPIALIQGYAEGLTEGMAEDPESRDYYCDVIMDEANKMNKMVKQLLTLTALEFGNDMPVMEQFDIVTLIKGIISSAGILLQQKGASVVFGQEATVWVWADEFKIEEVLSLIHISKRSTCQD